VGLIVRGIHPSARISASRAIPDRGHRWRLAWLIAVLLFGAAQILISVLRFDHLQADTLELGFQAQMLWLISHGHWYAFSSVFQTPALATDGSLWMYPLAYVFRYAGGVYALFTVQAAATAIAAWGLTRAARAQGWSPRAAYVVSLLFCLAPGVLGASQFDYHPDFLALPGLVWGGVRLKSWTPRKGDRSTINRTR
jgi:uncharacterized membrane protein